MATHHPTMLFLALLFLAAESSLAQRYSVNGTNIDRVEIVGMLVCTSDGNPVPGVFIPSVKGVDITRRCRGVQVGLAQVGSNNFYDMVVDTADVPAPGYDPAACIVYVQLPISSCSLLNKSGSLQATPSLTQVMQSPPGMYTAVFGARFSYVT